MANLNKRVFDLKFAAKQLTRNAKKLQKEEAKEIRQCWKHVVRGEHDIGKVHAENAVRNHNQSLDLLSLGARLQGVVNVLQVAAMQNGVTSAMDSVVSSMAAATRRMNVQTLTATMSRFERMTDGLGARQDYVSESLHSSGVRSVASDQADRLMARIVDRAGLDVRDGMTAAAADTAEPPESIAVDDATGALEEKLARLRNVHR